MTTTQPIQTAYASALQDRYRTALLLSIIGVLELHGQREAVEIVKSEFGQNAD